MPQKITPNLWFDGNAEEAAAFYVDVFADGKIGHIAHYPENSPGPAGTVMTVEWEVMGLKFIGINGGPQFKFDEAVSFMISCKDQDEVDYFWDRLTDGGEESQCGWCRDRFGLSWQVVPEGMEVVFNDPDKEKSQRAMQAMLQMKKLDIGALRAAAEGEAAG
jgi:predicted 3-demethylubiquinone-9 3-methyltransferase (glyoxalase superfamily)